VEWDSSIGITIRYGMDGRGSNPVQTGPGTHPVFCTMGTGLFLGVKWPGLGLDHPPPSSAEVKERRDLTRLLPLSVLSWQVLEPTIHFV
jgi:hypothetical protein